MLLKGATPVLLRAFNRCKSRTSVNLIQAQRGPAEAAALTKHAKLHASEACHLESRTCKYCNATIVEEKKKLPLFPTKLDSSSFESLLPDIDAFIFDADGVLWLGNIVIPGSPEFLEYLISKGKRVIILTNNSSRSRRYLIDKFRRMGFASVTEEHVVTPAAIITELLKSKKFPGNKSVYLIGSPGLHEELKEAGIECFGHGPDPMRGEEFDDDVFLDRDGFLYQDHFRDDVGAVIVGFEKYFNYVKMIKAANYLQNDNCLFLGTNEDETSPGPYPNTVIPDTGPILAAVKSASGREPVVVGKPHATAFEYISKRWNLSPKRTIMVGDRINTDICFGKNNGLKTMLVFTGCHAIPELTFFRENGNGNMLPDYFASSLGDLIRFQNLGHAENVIISRS